MSRARCSVARSVGPSLSFVVASFAGMVSASAADEVFTCPNTINAGGVLVGPPPAGWAGSGEGGPFAFKKAWILNRNQLVCGYSQVRAMAGLSRPPDAGATCTFLGAQRSWSCVDPTGATRSYPCPATLMVSSIAYGPLPAGWQGVGESGPFPFLNAPAPDARTSALRCTYRVNEFTVALVRPKPAGSCVFDAGRLTWTCKPPTIDAGKLAPSVAPNTGGPLR